MTEEVNHSWIPFASDHSQHIMFLQCSFDRSHKNKSCGKNNQSTECCAITQNNAKRNTLTKQHICSMSTLMKREGVSLQSLINNQRQRPDAKSCAAKKETDSASKLSLSVRQILKNTRISAPSARGPRVEREH